MKSLFRFFALLLLISFTLNIQAQDSGYKFTIKKELKATPVKDQYKSGTCWSFSAIAMLESELLRTGKGEFDLSEAFIMRVAFYEKAIQYVRFQGKSNFGGGGAFHDVTNMINKYGIVPEEVYPGLNYGSPKHNHAELDAVLTAYLGAVVENNGKELTTAWLNGFNGILDAYFGKYPENFTYKGKNYTPKSFAAELGLNMGDYVEITSFTHHPFYERFVMEVPDNWSYDLTYNVTINELVEIIQYAIDNGYTIAWASDVSEKGFSWSNGVAIVPNTNKEDLSGTEREKWEKLSQREKDAQLYKFDGSITEATITQEMRQIAFDNYTTTDDHGMQITGYAFDEKGNLFFKVKNSWGIAGSPYEGYFYASKAFVMLKTTDIMIHKSAIPPAISKKLGLK